MILETQSTSNRTILYLNATKCPACRQRTFLLMRSDECTAACPFCGATFPIPEDKGSRIGRVTSDSMIAFAISMACHVLLLSILGTVTWYFIEASGHGPGTTRVGLVSEDASESIESGSAPGSLAMPVSTGPNNVDVADIQPNLTVQAVAISASSTAASSSAKSVSAATISDLSLNGGNAGMSDAGAAGLVGGAAQMGGGGTQFFGTKAKGPFVYVIDCSGSMIGQKLAECIEELKTSIQKLGAQEKFYVIFYSSTYEAMPPKPALIRASTANKRNAFKWIDGPIACAGGGTDPSEAMELALSLKPKSIFLLTDGLFSEQVLDVIRRGNKGQKIQINTIAFYERAGEPILKKIAQENRDGKYRFVGPPEERQAEAASHKRRNINVAP